MTARHFWMSRSPEETRAHGERLGRLLRGGEVIALEGGLGAGKTHWIQGLAEGLQVVDGPVTSPTFVYSREFHGRCPLVHVDLFRIEREEDVPDLGILDYLGGTWVMAVEWAEKAGDFLPSERLTIRLTDPGETVRKIAVAAVGARYHDLLKTFVRPERNATLKTKNRTKRGT